jgi:hypothetical protein
MEGSPSVFKTDFQGSTAARGPFHGLWAEEDTAGVIP